MKAATKLSLLGWLHVAMHGLGLTFALILLVIATASYDRSSRAAETVVPLVLMLSTFVLVPGFVGGIGLLRRRPWARILMIAFSALELLVLPVGTAIGALALWILLDNDVKALFTPAGGASVLSARLSPSPSLSPSTSPSSSPSPSLSPSRASSAPALPFVDPKTFGALVAMVGLAAAMVIGLNAGFAISGDRAPDELAVLLYPALAVLAVTLAIGAWALARMLARRRAAPAASAAPTRAEFLARLAADPVRRPYVARIERGESWSDLQIDYDLDRAALATCRHLQPVERAIRDAGITVRRYAGPDVGADCTLDWPALSTRFALPLTVRYQEPPPHDRASEDSPVALVRCIVCHSSIIGWHPSTVTADSIVFPAR